MEEMFWNFEMGVIKSNVVGRLNNLILQFKFDRSCLFEDKVNARHDTIAKLGLSS